MAIAEVTLFHETPVYCLRPKEAVYLAGEVNDYLTHSIQLKAGDTIFDVGANIGVFSLWVCRQLQNNAVVYAFEPLPGLVEVLRLNAQRFAPDQIRVMPFGLSHTTQTMPFTFYPRATVWSTAYPALAYQERGETKRATLRSLDQAPRWIRRVPVGIWSALIDLVLKWVMRKTQTVTCALRTLSSVIDEAGIAQIDLLKIDVEHAELDVLRGVDAVHWPRIRQVIMEVHDIDDRLRQVTDLLTQHGFTQLVTDQQNVLQGSNIYLLYATR